CDVVHRNRFKSTDDVANPSFSDVVHRKWGDIDGLRCDLGFLQRNPSRTTVLIFKNVGIMRFLKTGI
ncbi:hypothetical protein, partial [Bifidobacterium saimiriisciurei]|uniref:hypothetical protein n=1 Tax=Bifidobacterium saimiriisciurei TaxID=2661627 RepID=UPI001CDC8CF5